MTEALAYKVPRTLDVYAIFVGSNDAINAIASGQELNGAEVAALTKKGAEVAASIEKRVSQLYKAGEHASSIK